MFRSPPGGRAGVLDRQSGPLAIGPFLQDLPHPRIGGVQRDVGVTGSVQDVDRGGMVGLHHHPSGEVKPVPAPDREQPGVRIDL